MTITDLPPTSYATEGHIQRAFYATHMQVNCLGDFSLNPQDYRLTTVYRGGRATDLI